MSDRVIYDLLVILAAGLVAGVACKRLRAPVLIGYMLVGVLIGSGGLQLVRHQSHDVEHLAEAGVFLLLFAIGLEFSLEELLRLGRHLVIGGSVQMTLVGAPVAAVLALCGFEWSRAILFAAAASFSSTVLVFKTLAEWGRTGTPEGRRAIGVLLFQDVALVPLLLLIPLLAGGGAPSFLDFVNLALKSVAFVGSVILLRLLLAGWVIPHLVSYRSAELVALAAVVVLGGVTYATYRLGLPPAVGALAAGLMLGGNRWTKQFDALVMPFRETFTVIFFVSLGLMLEPRVVLNEPILFISLLLALIAVKWAAAAVALRLTRLSWRSSLATGVGLAHVGEFAFVLVTIAAQADVLTDVNVQRFVAVSLVSLMLSPLLLRFGLKYSRPLGLEEETLQRGRAEAPDKPKHALVIGVGPIGRRVASHLETIGYEVCAVDLSPLNLYPFQQQGFHAVAGNATEIETLERAEAERASLVVISVPDDSASLETVRLLRQMNPTGEILVRCRYQENESQLKQAGATHVVSEEFQSGEALIRLLGED